MTGTARPSGKPKILFVDDDMFLASLYIDALIDAGFSVATADSVAEALSLAHSEPFDVAIIDVMMPPGPQHGQVETAGGLKTGKVLAREIRDALPDAKLIALSMSNDADVIDWFSRNESVAFLAKQRILPQDLPQQVRKMLGVATKLPHVFIVHGHDMQALFELKNFLQNRLRFPEPIVLREKADRGMTLIEKFEHYAGKAGLVFVLLTPDDFGALAASPSEIASRPRMNVVFEYGYFLGSLSRRSSRVILLRKGELEIPSDLSGVVSIDISQGIEAAGEAIRRELADWL